MPMHDTSNRPARLLGLLFWGWVTALALFTLSAHITASRGGSQSLPSGSVLLMENAAKALAAIQAQDGAFPPSAGAWLALFPEDMAGQSPAALRDALSRAKPWSGVPGSALIYRSDGKDYKLVWHKPGNCNDLHAISPGLVDPVRTTYSRSMIAGGWTVTDPNERTVAPLKSPMVKPDPAILDPLFGECWAWGVWTPGAVFW
ncbi:hypothetical protein [Fundidesulfovibrio putealis]|uniref:hypothetical protein n=1 Tax=Fundidesulfovibrio putealis TaxID=270496 RepID=UPI000487B40D|nr:hypothetical protein [Fundidesulfovibrio putealis]